MFRLITENVRHGLVPVDGDGALSSVVLGRGIVLISLAAARNNLLRSLSSPSTRLVSVHLLSIM